MRWQTSAVLALLLVLVGGFYYLYEVRWAADRERAESRKGRIFGAEAADVTALELKRPDETVTLKRDGDAWRLTTPIAARGNKGTVDEALTTFVTAKIDREIEGKPAVFVLSDSVLREATRPVVDFRDRTILSFERRDVTGVDIVTDTDAIAVESTADNKWRLTRPVALAADTAEMNDLLDKLATGKVKEFVAEAPRSRQAYGLERPLRISVHTGKDKDRATRTLLVGRTDAEKKGVYAMREGEASVLLLPEDIGKLVPRNVAAIRNKQLVDFERDRITRVEVESPKGAVTLVKEKDRWTIAAPEALPADQVEAGALLARLKEV